MVKGKMSSTNTNVSEDPIEKMPKGKQESQIEDKSLEKLDFLESMKARRNAKSWDNDFATPAVSEVRKGTSEQDNTGHDDSDDYEV